MKIKDGKIKLDGRDRRIGNFVITDEPDHYKVQAVNLHWSLRMAKDTKMGRMIGEGLSDRENEEGFARILAYLYTVSSSVGDIYCIRETVTAIEDSSKRMSINAGNPVIVYSSPDELCAAVLNALQSHNVWLDEDEIKAVNAVMEANFNRSRDIYCPPELMTEGEGVLENEMIVASELSRAAENS